MNQKTDLPKRKFGLLTTVAMIAGIVIGSGIFFQTPRVIRAVEGNLFYGAACYVIVAFGIIFGGLTIAQYAVVDENVGGVITYCEMAWGKTMGYLAGFFQIIFYYPALVAAISWVAASFTFALFGLPNILTDPGNYIENIGTYATGLWALTIAIMFGFYFMNTIKTKLAGNYQSFSLIAKLCALVVLAVCGIFFGKPVETLATAADFPGSQAGLFAALGFVAFAYDGWMVAPSVAHEIKDSKKNLTASLIFAPILVTVVYLSFYFGLVSFVGPQAILDGADPTSILAGTLFGNVGMKVVLAFVVVSITGTLNGLILGYIRLPYALAIRNEIFLSNQLAKINKKLDVPVASAVLAFVIPLVWLFLHFASIDGDIMWGWSFVRGLEVDVLPIILMCFFLVSLYVGVMVKKIGNSTKFVDKVLNPLLASLGAGIVIYGASTKELFYPYIYISLAMIIAALVLRPGLIFKGKNKEKTEDS